MLKEGIMEPTMLIYCPLSILGFYLPLMQNFEGNYLMMLFIVSATIDAEALETYWNYNK